MTAETVLVRFGHPVGGWVPYVDPKRGPAPDAFVQTADELGMQPPHTVLPLPDRALFGLRVVEVRGHGRYWCFTSQSIGRARQLRAGGCDFVFAPFEQWEPGPFWWHCTASAEVAPPGDRPVVAGDAPEPALAGHVEGVLRNMLTGYPFIPVEARPEVVARVIGHLLDVLPPEEVAPRTWWTCLLRTRHVGKLGVSGRWPGDLPQDDVTLIDRLFDTPPAATEMALERQDEAVVRLAQLAVHGPPGRRERPHPATTSLRMLLSAIAEYDLDVTADDVPRLYADDRQFGRLEAVPGVVGDFAAARPDEAWRLLSQVLRTTPITRAVLEGFQAATPPDRLWSAGTASAQDIARLAVALCVAFPVEPHGVGHDARADAVRRYFRAERRGLSDRRDLENAHDFLRRLDLTREQYPDLFPPRSQTAARQLQAGAWQQSDLVAELHVMGHAPAQETLLVARELGPGDIGPVAALLGAMIDPAQDGEVQPLPDGYLDALEDHVGVGVATDGDDRGRDDWLVSVAEICRPPVRHTVAGALLNRIDDDVATAPHLLVLALRMTASGEVEFTSAVGRVLAARAADSLEAAWAAAAPGPAPVDALPSGDDPAATSDPGKPRRRIRVPFRKTKDAAAPAPAPAEEASTPVRRADRTGSRQRRSDSSWSTHRPAQVSRGNGDRRPTAAPRASAGTGRDGRHAPAGVVKTPRGRVDPLPSSGGKRAAQARSPRTPDGVMTFAIVVAAGLLVILLLVAVALRIS